MSDVSADELRQVRMVGGLVGEPGPYFVGFGDEWRRYDEWEPAWSAHVFRGSTKGASRIMVRDQPGATEKNRAQRHAKIDNAIDGSIRMLLDGLEVDSIQALKALVDAARNVSTIYEGLRVDANDGSFALWREDELVVALHALGNVAAA